MAGLLNCDAAQGLYQLSESAVDCRWLIVSGGDQKELRQVFMARNLHHLCNGGVYGSPDNKDMILSREIEKGNMVIPRVFFGSSQYEFKSAKRAELNFPFVSGWSELKFSFSEADYVLEKLSLCI